MRTVLVQAMSLTTNSSGANTMHVAACLSIVHAGALRGPETVDHLEARHSLLDVAGHVDRRSWRPGAQCFRVDTRAPVSAELASTA